MRKLLIGSLVSVILLASCSENHNLVLLKAVIPPADTSYVTTPESPLPHNVLFEEFTGASCANCPTGHEVLDTQVSQHQGRINVIALHCNVPSGEVVPADGQTYDFRTDYAKQIASLSFYNNDPTSVLPDGGVDRAPYAGLTYIENTGSWAAAIAARIDVDSSPVNLYISSTFDSTKDTAAIQVTIKYTRAAAPGQQNLSIALVEDSIIDRQRDGTHVDTYYVFNNIFRDLITQSNGIAGDPILAKSTSIVAGTVDVRRYTYHVNVGKPTQGTNNVLLPRNCRLVAFVTDVASGVVYQSVQCNLVSP